MRRVNKRRIRQQANKVRLPPSLRSLCTSVMDLRVGRYVGKWSLHPREAVIAAFAQLEKKDWNTWDYEKHYSASVVYGLYSVRVEDYAALCGAARALGHTGCVNKKRIASGAKKIRKMKIER